MHQSQKSEYAGADLSRNYNKQLKQYPYDLARAFLDDWDFNRALRKTIDLRTCTKMIV